MSETRTIASTTQSTDARVYTTQYTYDSFNRLQRMVYPDGETLTFRYDAGGRLRQITGRKGPSPTSTLPSGVRQVRGAAFVEAGNGTRTTYAYRPRNR